MTERTLTDARTELDDCRRRRAALAEKLDNLNAEITAAKAEVSGMLAESEAGDRRYQSLPARKDALSKMRAEAEYLTDALEILDAKLPGFETEVLTLESSERLARYALERDSFEVAAREVASLTEELRSLAETFLTERVAPALKRLRESRPSQAWNRLPACDRSARFYTEEARRLGALPVSSLKIDQKLTEEADALLRQEVGEAQTQARFASVRNTSSIPAPAPAVEEEPALPFPNDAVKREEFMLEQLRLGRAVRALSGRIVMKSAEELARLDGIKPLSSTRASAAGINA